ncbi:YlbG family protein [Exiguobacterium artemiae]|uniref:YlbG family protein n=1 Tax=Exiguobacterium sp. S22-S28 TaxID=3342768 RepID=UPI0011CA975A
MIKERIGLIVYVKALKASRQLRRYGNVYFTSKRERYVFLYVDLERYEQVVERIAELPFVERVVRSERPFIVETYANKKGKMQEEV